jgi:penicillin amidase
MRVTSFLRPLVLTSLLSSAAIAAEAPAGANDAATTWRVSGLDQTAEIIVDHWGVPHIYAQTHYDAFFVQGFNAARDRLWQIDLWRRRGLGLLSEAFGAAYVDQDRAARLFLYRGDMYPEWLAYGSDAKRIAEAFTAGINAYVDLIDANPELLPPEFELLDYRPARWAPEDVVRIRSHGIAQNVASEVRRARIACELGLEATQLAKVLEPAWETTIPEGLDPCRIPEGVLDEYFLARAPVRFDALHDNAAAARQRAALIAETRTAAESQRFGSNNWSVSPSRTATGRAILANDPHRAHAVPSLRYIAHLTAPGLNVIGGGEPALPGISIGHNERIAFGLTVFYIDQEDLYVYEKARLHGRRSETEEATAYVYQGRSEPVRTVTEEIPVRNEAPRPIRLSFTRHGPVVYESDKQLYAVRAASLEPGMAPYFGSVEYMRAANWREFLAAMNRWGSPSENQVFADVDGNIGYKPGGRFPRRTNHDGLLPVPGDGRFEWDGYWDMDALPVEFNPPRGFTGTANAMNLPPGYPIAERRVGFEWSAPWRYRRVMEVLAGQPGHSLTDSHALQRDYLSILAREVVAKLPDAAAHPDHQGLALLKSWDARLPADSAAAALFAVWYYRHLQTALLEFRLSGSTAIIPTMDSLAVVETLDRPGAMAEALGTLTDAWAETVRLLGEDPDQWQWGDLHRIRFQHPLLDLAPPTLAETLALPDYPRGGTGNTTNNTGFDPADFLVRSGASYRMVLDVGRWDDAEMTNAPGQSGDPRSPFYGNLLEGWATDSSFPLLYSREAVEANQALRIELRPAD